MSEMKTTVRPDDLLQGIGKSIMAKALLYSVIGHFVLTVLTSFSLFKDWTVYGVKSPSAINAIRTQENRAKEEEARRQKAAAKAAAAQAAEEAAKTNQVAAAAGGTNATAQATGGTNAAVQAVAPAATGGAVTPPEVQPLPPKKEFEYGDDLSLD